MATVVSAALAILATGHLAAEPDAVTVGARRGRRGGPGPRAAAARRGLRRRRAAGRGGRRHRGRRDDGPRRAGRAASASAAGVCALIGLRVASYDYPSRFVHLTAGVALPLTAAAPAVYLLGRALG